VGRRVILEFMAGNFVELEKNSGIRNLDMITNHNPDLGFTARFDSIHKIESNNTSFHREILMISHFKYLGSIIQKDGEINSDANHRIQVGWLK